MPSERTGSKRDSRDPGEARREGMQPLPFLNVLPFKCQNHENSEFWSRLIRLQYAAFEMDIAKLPSPPQPADQRRIHRVRRIQTKAGCIVCKTRKVKASTPRGEVSRLSVPSYFVR